MATTITKLFPTGVLQSAVEFDEISLTLAGQQEFTTPGTYSWTAPAGVTSVCVVAVGGGGGAGLYNGGGGGGGALAYKNNISVTPGQSYTVIVGAAGTNGTVPASGIPLLLTSGGDSSFSNGSITLIAGGGKFGKTVFGTTNDGSGFYGQTGGAGGVPSGTYDGGGAGGAGGTALSTGAFFSSGGGGAGGYSGVGGTGGGGLTDATSGVGGSGGGGQRRAFDNLPTDIGGGGGGGVGIYGLGSSGSAGVTGSTGGSGGSGGNNGFSPATVLERGTGGGYGGGGGSNTGQQLYSPTRNPGIDNGLCGDGSGGAVRIIWGAGRAFPSTNTNNMVSSFRVSPTGVYAREFDEVTLTPTILAGITTGGTGSYNVGEGIVVDSSGNTYVVGWTGPSNVVSSICLIKYDSTGTVLWQTKLAGSEVKTKGYKVAVDSSNNVYIVGSDSSSASPFGWVVTAKFNSDGAIQWQRKLETVNTQGKNAVALDSSGNVYVAATARFNNRQTCLLIKYDSNGTIQWQRRFYESTSGYSIFIHGIAVDSSGNVYACGSLGNFPTSIVVVKYNTSGVYQWHSTLGNASPDDARAYGMSVDSSNNIYITGTIYNSGAGVWSMFLAKINSSGALQWQRTLTPPGTPAVQPTGYGVTVDSSGNVYTVGFYNDIWDVILTKHDVSGTLQWQRNLSSSGYEVGHNISLDLNGNICITGFVSASSDADIFLFSKLPTDGSRTGNYNIGQYSFTYSASLQTTATSTISYNIGSPGYTLLSTDPGITESAGILTVSAGTLVSTNNGGGVVIPAERRTSTGTYMVSGYFDEITIAPPPPVTYYPTGQVFGDNPLFGQYAIITKLGGKYADPNTFNEAIWNNLIPLGSRVIVKWNNRPAEIDMGLVTQVEKGAFYNSNHYVYVTNPSNFAMPVINGSPLVDFQTTYFRIEFT